MNFLKLQQNISNICKTQYGYFFNKKNVTGIGLGYKRKDGFYTCDLCIQVFVVKKISKCKLCPNDIIPICFKGIKTDVVETGIFRAASLKERKRPVIGGYSIGPNINIINGTAGCLVTNGVTNFVLSSNHVLANGNALPIGSPILQPSRFFAGKPSKDSIGSLSKYVPIRFIEGGEEPINYSDCAIAILEPQNVMKPEIAFIGKPTCVKSPILNAPVKKVGSITELTEGRITSISSMIRVTYPNGKRAMFYDCTLTTKMGEDGDSGALLINRNMCGIGLMVGNSINSSIYNRLDRILDQLGVHLVP